MLASGAHKLDSTERTNDVQITENVNFEGLLLSEQTLAGLSECGFEKPSPIQFKAIPFGKCGFDLIAQAKSGTGKTCMFGVIALEMIQLPSKSLQVLILAPTREIAAQVADVITTIGQGHEGLNVATFIGGMPIEEDKRNARNCHVAVGSPGRMKQLIDEKVLNIEHVRLVVLDEADKLMEPGFLEDINHIFSLLPENKQTLAASATYTEELKTFLEMYMRSPLRVSPESLQTNGDATVLLGVRQSVGFVNFHPNMLTKFRRKLDALVYLLSSIPFKQCLVFNNLHGQAESMSQLLNTKGFPTEFISGHMEQPRRLRAIASLVDFKCRVLLSTDLSARGLDAANVDLVINMDIPLNEATYLHRVGRAGRFGSKGLVVTIAENSGKDLDKLYNISSKIHVKLHCFNLNINEAFTLDLWNPSSLLPLEQFSIKKTTKKPRDETSAQKSEEKKMLEKINAKKIILEDVKESDDSKNTEVNGSVSSLQSKKEKKEKLNSLNENSNPDINIHTQDTDETIVKDVEVSSKCNEISNVAPIIENEDNLGTAVSTETVEKLDTTEIQEELNISSESAQSGKSKPTKPPRKLKVETLEDYSSKLTSENVNLYQEISSQVDNKSPEMSIIELKSAENSNEVHIAMTKTENLSANEEISETAENSSFPSLPGTSSSDFFARREKFFEERISRENHPKPRFGHNYSPFGERHNYSRRYQDHDRPYVSNHPRDTYSPGYVSNHPRDTYSPGYPPRRDFTPRGRGARPECPRFNDNYQNRGNFNSYGGDYQRQNHRNIDLTKCLSRLFQEIKSYSLPSIKHEVLDYNTLKKLADLYVHYPGQRAIEECRYPRFSYAYLLTGLRKQNGDQVIKTKQKFIKHGGTIEYLKLLAKGYESDTETIPTPSKELGRNFYNDYPKPYVRIQRSEWTLGYKLDEEGNIITTKPEKKIPQSDSTSSDDEIFKVCRRKKSCSKSESSRKKSDGTKSNIITSSDSDDETDSIPSSEPELTETEGLYCKKPQKTTSIETVYASSQQINVENEKLSEMEEVSEELEHDMSKATDNASQNIGAAGNSGQAMGNSTGYNPYEYPPLPSDPSELDVWKQQVKLTTFMIHYAKYMEFMYTPTSK